MAEKGSSQPLMLRELSEPVPQPGEVLVGVRASALNQADLRLAASHFAGSEARSGAAVAGLEMAGEVLAVASDVQGVAVGDRVMGMTGAAWAEQVVLDHRLLMPVPAGFTWAQAAATPISFLTAHDALSRAAHLRPGESVLVQGATSAAGLASLQVARALGAGEILGTTNSPGKVGRLREAGCDLPICRSVDDVASVVSDATGRRGVDVVIDILGGSALRENVDSACVTGRIVCLGRMAGAEASLNLDEFSRKRITMVGVTFRTRSMDERVAAVARFNAEMVPLLEAGDLRPVIDRTYVLDDVHAAYEHLQQPDRIGKIVLLVGEG